MKKTILLLLFCTFHFSNAYALKCNHHLIQTGDRKAEVLHFCGDPDYVDIRYINDGTRLRDPNRTLELSRYKETTVEEWTYNFGRHKLMRLLIFENNKLKDIQVLGYGY